jgi:hypothetical protein
VVEPSTNGIPVDSEIPLEPGRPRASIPYKPGTPVTDGIVRLDGTVPTYSQKITSAQDARRIKGVIGVVNNPVLRPAQVWTHGRRRLDHAGRGRCDQ